MFRLLIDRTKANDQSQQEQQLKEFQSNYDLLKQEKEQLQREQNEYQVRIEQLQKSVNETHQTGEQAQQELQQRVRCVSPLDLTDRIWFDLECRSHSSERSLEKRI